MSANDLITVVTITRRRPGLLARAIESVTTQSFPAIEHLVIVDDCPETAAALDERARPGLRWTQTARQPHERTGPGRVGRLRNRSVGMVRSGWIAFLDDDNTWREDHLRTLLARAQRSGCRAVHSYRELRHEDGSPYLRPYFPWAASPVEARDMHRRAVEAGVISPGSPVVP